MAYCAILCTARRGAEGTEAGNFQGDPKREHLPGLSGMPKKREPKYNSTVADRTTRSMMRSASRARGFAGILHFSHPLSQKEAALNFCMNAGFPRHPFRPYYSAQCTAGHAHVANHLRASMHRTATVPHSVVRGDHPLPLAIHAS